MSRRGIWTVARLELTQRARTSRWPVVLGIWVLVVGSVTTLSYYATRDPQVNSGRTMYDLTTFFVLGLSMLVMPALTATSVNGDREAGVLATLQTTLLTPADIILGKLLASWVVAMTFLGATLPFLAWGWAVGGVSVGSILGSLLVLVLVLAVVCALGLMFSTLTARPVASAVLTYLTVAFLTIGTVLTFFLAFPLVTQREQVRYFGLPEEYWNPPGQDSTKPDLPPQEPTTADCRHLTRVDDVQHTERIWWLLAVNPFVVVADAGPGGTADERSPEYAGGITPMREISQAVRSTRVGPDGAERQECWVMNVDAPDPGGLEAAAQAARQPVWPLGLGALLLVGGAGTVVAVRRTRTPVRRLPNGTRIA